MKILATFILFFIVAASGFCQSSYYEDYLIPNDYVGWVRAVHEVEDEPPLPVEDGRFVFKFDESGVLKTSDNVHVGSIYANYYYYTDATKMKLPDKAEGGGGMIHNKGVANVKILDFFVGTENQYSLWYTSNCGKEKDNNGFLPKNIKKCLDDYEKSKASGK